jgi:uncharacterized iron-regulated protein
MKKNIYTLLAAIGAILIYPGCKKDNSSTPKQTQTAVSNDTVMYGLATYIILPTYQAAATNAQSLYSAIQQFQTLPSTANLALSKQWWLQASASYQLAEAYNFGPFLNNGVAGSLNPFPNLDTTAIDTIVNGTSTLSGAYFSNAAFNVQGFHALEFLLWGGNSNKQVSAFTPRQYTYMLEMANIIDSTMLSIYNAWDDSVAHQFVYAGRGSSSPWSTLGTALADMVSEQKIESETDETQKIGLPLEFWNNGPQLEEESPFADNTLTDVRNNIIGIQNAYLGVFGSTQTNGITAIVQQSNIALDNKIKADFNNVFNALNAVTVKPFYIAVQASSQQNLVKNLFNICDTLDKDYLNKLLPFIEKTVKKHYKK